MHANRVRRKANEERRAKAVANHEPLPIDEQEKRAAERQAHYRATYPVAPTYLNHNERPAPRPMSVGKAAKTVIPTINWFFLKLMQAGAAKRQNPTAKNARPTTRRKQAR